jgi:Rho family protein
LENVETKWKQEIEENCPGVKIVLVALKCDLREAQDEDDEENATEPKRPMIEYKQGLQVAQNIKALRYLGKMRFLCNKVVVANLITECSAMKNRGVREAFNEAARVALSVKTGSEKSKLSKCVIM